MLAVSRERLTISLSLSSPRKFHLPDTNLVTSRSQATLGPVSTNESASRVLSPNERPPALSPEKVRAMSVAGSEP